MKYSEKLADATCEDFKRNFDIAEELWITLDCKDFPAPGYYITVRGYSAEELYNNYKLNVLGAYNYLIFLREEPMRALELLMVASMLAAYAGAKDARISVRATITTNRVAMALTLRLYRFME